MISTVELRSCVHDLSRYAFQLATVRGFVLSATTGEVAGTLTAMICERKLIMEPKGGEKERK